MQITRVSVRAGRGRARFLLQTRIIASITFLILSVLSSHPLAAAEPALSPLVVIGFVGGFVRHNDSVHKEVQMAAHLEKDYPTAMTVRVFENHMGPRAHAEILRLLDSDRDGTLSEGEKTGARIVLYGHSWGASETVSMARLLQKDGVPVLLTVQVDSVTKGNDDRLIPANVAQAVNFYQSNGLLHGQSRIVAADAERTEILGNFQSDYRNNPVNTDGFPWFAKTFMKAHIQIESDPGVWNRIEAMIRAKLPGAGPPSLH